MKPIDEEQAVGEGDIPVARPFPKVEYQGLDPVDQPDNIVAISGSTVVVSTPGVDYDGFGSNVSISGETAIVGARDDDDNGSASGSAYIFSRNADDSWSQKLNFWPASVLYMTGLPFP